MQGNLECSTWINLDLDRLVGRVLNERAAGWLTGWVSAAVYYSPRLEPTLEPDLVAFTRAVKTLCAEKPRNTLAESALGVWQTSPRR